MKQSKRDDGFRISDELWEQIEPLLPAAKRHPLGCHRPRVSNRAAMDAILLVLRAVERPGRYRHLHLLVGVSTVSGVD